MAVLCGFVNRLADRLWTTFSVFFALFCLAHLAMPRGFCLFGTIGVKLPFKLAFRLGIGGFGARSGLEFSHRLDGLFPSPAYEHDGATFIAKSLPHFTGQILFVLVGEQIFAVHE